MIVHKETRSFTKDPISVTAFVQISCFFVD